MVLTYSVTSRYFLHLSTDWQDELSVFLIVGAVFMSSAAIQARRGHVGIEAIVGLLSPAVNHWRQLAVDLPRVALARERDHADRAVVLVEGRQRHEGAASALLSDPEVAALYLGGIRQAASAS